MVRRRQFPRTRGEPKQTRLQLHERGATQFRCLEAPGGEGQYSSASIKVRTRVVTASFAGSGEPPSHWRS